MKFKNFNREILKSDFEAGWAQWSFDSNKGLPALQPQKPYAATDTLIDLVLPNDFDFNIKLIDAIKDRRSRRKYTYNPLTLKELSFLLWAAQGRSDKNIHTHRTVPSAGACNPFETYVIIQNIENLSPGVYRYLPIEHKLCVISLNQDAVKSSNLCCFEANQARMQNAAAIFVWATIPYRSEWRLGPYAYKMIALEAGHVMQNFSLAAEAIKCGACAIAAYDQKIIDQAINVNGRDEFTVYLATIGKV